MLELFKVQEFLPFLAFMNADDKAFITETPDMLQEPRPRISLACTNGTKVPELTWSELWGDPHVFGVSSEGFVDGLQLLRVKVNTLRNQIAVQTRRHVGNIVLIGEHPLAQQLKEILDDEVKTIVTPNIPADEVRVLLFIAEGKVFEACDGPVQICEDEIRLNPNYKAYFAWTKL